MKNEYKRVTVLAIKGEKENTSDLRNGRFVATALGLANYAICKRILSSLATVIAHNIPVTDNPWSRTQPMLVRARVWSRVLCRQVYMMTSRIDGPRTLEETVVDFVHRLGLGSGIRARVEAREDGGLGGWKTSASRGGHLDAPPGFREGRIMQHPALNLRCNTTTFTFLLHYSRCGVVVLGQDVSTSRIAHRPILRRVAAEEISQATLHFYRLPRSEWHSNTICRFYVRSIPVPTSPARLPNVYRSTAVA